MALGLGQHLLPGQVVQGRAVQRLAGAVGLSLVDGPAHVGWRPMDGYSVPAEAMISRAGTGTASDEVNCGRIVIEVRH